MTDGPSETEITEFLTKQRKFYATVGHCVLRYQHVEDYLGDLFASVLGGPRDRSDAIFASVRGTDRRLQIIAAAATGLKGAPWIALPDLLRRIKNASDVRGQIAHAQPVQISPPVQIRVKTDEGRIVKVVEVESSGKSRFELRKTTAKQVVTYTVQDLLHAYDKIDRVFGDMIDFVRTASAIAK